jgi:hypothetical protein
MEHEKGSKLMDSGTIFFVAMGVMALFVLPYRLLVLAGAVLIMALIAPFIYLWVSAVLSVDPKEVVGAKSDRLMVEESHDAEAR